MRVRTPNIIWKHPLYLMAYGFGAGAIPFAPGTFGTLVAIPIYYLMQGLNLYLYLVLCLLAFLFGVWICGITAKAIKIKDPGGIVWDEIVGYLITMIAIPFSWWALISGFLLFRLFDIWKPWPIRVIDQKLSGGLGIMLDDVLAGIFALICLHLLHFIL